MKSAAAVPWKMIVLLTGALLAGCGQTGVRGQLAEWLTVHCAHSSTCVIDMANFTRFSWQTMFVFHEGARQETISQIIGSAYPEYDTITERTVFTADGRIVWSEDHMPDYDGKDTQSLVFEDAPGTEGFFRIERNNSLVDVRVEWLGQHVFYHLTPRR